MMYRMVVLEKRAKQRGIRQMMQNGCKSLKIRLGTALHHSPVGLSHFWSAGSQVICKSFWAIIVACSSRAHATISEGLETQEWNRFICSCPFKSQKISFRHDHCPVFNFRPFDSWRIFRSSSNRVATTNQLAKSSPCRTYFHLTLQHRTLKRT